MPSLTFGTFQYTTEPERSSGFSGFPFPLRLEPPTIGGNADVNNYPVPRDPPGRFYLQDCIAYWHKVKRWRLTHAVSGGSFGGTYGIPNPYDFNNLENPSAAAPTRELEIPFAFGTNISLFLPSSDDSGFVFKFYPGAPPQVNPDSLYRDAEGRYFPYMNVSGQLLSSVFSTGTGEGLEAQSLLVTIDGKYELPVYSTPGTADFSGYLHIDPLEYWDY